MSEARHPIPDETRLAQAEAADPQASVWVSAHAGSGKTHVLSKRVVRLLLRGVDPSRILCLTYTKAAASNMSNRIFKDLGGWAMMGDVDLRTKIEELEGKAVDAETVRRARRLFARALETPGGLKIQTIHAFCEALLHQFPLEANIAGHFELLDGPAAAALIAEARRELLIGTSGEDRELAEAFAAVLDIGGEFGLEKLLDEIVANRSDLAEVAADRAELAAEHGFAPGDSDATIAAAIWPDSYFHALRIEALRARAETAGKSTAADFAQGLAVAQGFADPAAALKAASKAVLTKEGTVVSGKRIAAKGVAEHFPGLEEEIARFGEAVRQALDRMSLLAMVSATEAALVIADKLMTIYARLKAARGYLDFEDLIRRTVSLFAREDVGPWIQFRLDQGIDHVLVDEAQDTSPNQWLVVSALVEEFFAGEGARPDTLRTLFAVGDEKQSIYSFQGAEPAAFDEHRQHFRVLADGVGRLFHDVGLTYSFRSTEDVLTAVDHVFENEDTRRGLTQEGSRFTHRAIRSGIPGEVEAWAFATPTEVDEPDDWTQSIDHARAPAVVVAERIAEQIRAWTKGVSGAVDVVRHAAPGDILILVRKRDSFVHAMTRALKNRDVPVAGADRLSLPDHIAVQDMIALGRVVLQPDDDLSLAALLKSPVFGLTDEALFAVAHPRKPVRSLMAALRDAAPGDLFLGPVVERLDQWRREAGFSPAFEFFGRILGRDGIRQRMIARLGHEAAEILDEFQTFLLNAERAGAGNLEAALALLAEDGPDIKREMDQTRNEVRIMTVHAAKGLEAPIVFLVDSGGEAALHTHLPRLAPYRNAEGARRVLWRAASEIGNASAKAIETDLLERAAEEYRRLLYVGMTRARDRLIVCGYHGVRGPSKPTWLGMVRSGLRDRSGSSVIETEAGEVLRFSVTPRVAPERIAQKTQSPEKTPLPAFFKQRIAAPPRLPKPLAPSRAGALIEPGPEPVSTRSPVLDEIDPSSFALQRGSVIHRLLQVLPTVEPDFREAAMRRYLASAAATWPEPEREAVCRSVEAVLNHTALAPLFTPESRAEVSVMGTLEFGGVPRAIAGSIDRLAVTPDRVLILDYKTNRPPPADLGGVPETYIAQLALYRALLRPIYPSHRIEAALLFTEGPTLISLPDQVLDAALARLSAA